MNKPLEQSTTETSSFYQECETHAKTPTLVSLSINKKNFDENGLRPGVEYKFDKFDLVDWQGMIPPRYFGITDAGKTRFRADKGKDWDSLDLEEKDREMTELDDRDKLILLAGCKHIAFLRGIKSQREKIISSDENSAEVEFTIEFLPNFETNFETVTYTSSASASKDNVSGKTFQSYLVRIAANRAQTAAIKDALRIEVLGKDEIAINEPERAASSVPDYKEQPRITMKKLLKEKAISFEKLKELMDKKGKWKDEWSDFDSIPLGECVQIVSALKAKKDS